jgi:hypothetical protein
MIYPLRSRALLAAAILMSALTLSALTLTGCSSSKITAEPAPSWTTDRPIVQGQYVGIGSAHKSASEPGAALRSAKERAVSDLASEISVRVESESLLESLSKNGVIDERFQHSIRSSSEAHLEGYQLVDSYDDGFTVHVYYRLSKTEHAARRAALKSAALDEGQAQLDAGNSALEGGRLPLALSHYGDGLRALEPFLGEVIKLDRELVRALRTAVSDLLLTTLVQSITLSTQNSFSFPLALKVKRERAAGEPGRALGPVGNVPLRYRYHNGTYFKQATEFTDGQGMVVALITDVEVERPDDMVRVEVDLPRLIEQSGLKAWGAMLDGVVAPTLALPLAVELPSVFVDCSQSALRGAFRTALSSGGHGLSDTAVDADVVISLEVEVRAGSVSRGFHTAWASGQIVARHQSGHIIYEHSIPQLKGIQLDGASARAEAISNLSKQLHLAPMRDLLRALH